MFESSNAYFPIIFQYFNWKVMHYSNDRYSMQLELEIWRLKIPFHLTATFLLRCQPMGAACPPNWIGLRGLHDPGGVAWLDALQDRCAPYCWGGYCLLCGGVVWLDALQDRCAPYCWGGYCLLCGALPQSVLGVWSAIEKSIFDTHFNQYTPSFTVASR